MQRYLISTAAALGLAIAVPTPPPIPYCARPTNFLEARGMSAMKWYK